MDERTIFLNALDEGDPERRRAYLDAACAGKPELRQRVEALLRAHQNAGDFLDVPAMEQIGSEDQALAFLAPASEASVLGRLDHYEVLEVVGRGSTGVVLRGRDTKLRRIVAIKMLVHGLAFSPSDPLLATCGEDGTVRLWNLTGSDPHPRVIGAGPFGGPIRSVAFTPDGRYLATANANGTVYFLRVGRPVADLSERP
jgi:hypothetical protein